MNMFSYYITTYFITINKDYNSCRNLLSVYQTYPNGNVITNNMKSTFTYIETFFPITKGMFGTLNEDYDRNCNLYY